MANMKIGYARKSTQEQDLAHQVDALKAAGCSQIYEEQVSRGGQKRVINGTPQLEACLKSLRPGDTLVVWALDRLGGTLAQLVSLMDDLKARGVQFESLKENIQTGTPAGDVYYQMIAVFSNFERSRNIERTRSGLAAARARGRIGGRKPAFSDDDWKEVETMLTNPEITVAAIAKRFGVSRQTIYRNMREKGTKHIHTPS